MNRTIERAIVFFLITGTTYLAHERPDIFSDSNQFFKNLFGPDFLSLLGLIVTLTLAATTKLHSEINILEEKVEQEIFINTRKSIRNYSYLQIILLFFAFVILSIKGLSNANSLAASFCNLLCIHILIVNLWSLSDLTRMAFTIKPF